MQWVRSCSCFFLIYSFNCASARRQREEKWEYKKAKNGFHCFFFFLKEGWFYPTNVKSCHFPKIFWKQHYYFDHLKKNSKMISLIILFFTPFLLASENEFAAPFTNWELSKIDNHCKNCSGECYHPAGWVKGPIRYIWIDTFFGFSKINC